MPDTNPLSTGWLLGQIKGNFNPGPPESSIGINLPEPLGCQPSKHSKPSRKPLQPTHWECRCMIARTHHAGFWCVETWQKPLLLFDWAWLPSTNCRFLSCSQNLTCYPWVSRCTDRSRWSLATVTSSHSRASMPGGTDIVEYQAQLFGNVLSLIGYMRQNWPRKHLDGKWTMWSFRYRPATFSSKSWLLHSSGLPSPRQRLEAQACSVIGQETARQEEHNLESFSSSRSVVLILAIWALLQRLSGRS